MAAFESEHEVLVPDEAPAPDVYKEHARLHRKQPRPCHKAGCLWRGRQAIDHDIGLWQKSIQRVQRMRLVKACRNICLFRPAHTRNPRAEGLHAPRDVSAEVAHAKDQRALSANRPGRFPLLPNMRFLVAPIGRQRPVKRNNRAQHVLGNYRPERAGDVAERHTLRKALHPRVLVRTRPRELQKRQCLCLYKLLLFRLSDDHLRAGKRRV